MQGWVFYGSDVLRGEDGFKKRADFALAEYKKQRNSESDLTEQESFVHDLDERNVSIRWNSLHLAIL